MGNPHARTAETHLELSRQSSAYREQSRDHVAAAAVSAQLAIVHELNTIGRILAQTAEIISPVNNSAGEASSTQHNAILERLGL